MIMANELIDVTGNTLVANPTGQVMVVAYPKPFTDKTYNPLPRGVWIVNNTYVGGGDDPQLPGGDQLKAALGGALPPVLWDGLGEAPMASGGDDARALSLNLPAQGAGAELARPAPLILARAMPQIVPVVPGASVPRPPKPGAPSALDARARP
jgi:hypothetical protein